MYGVKEPDEMTPDERAREVAEILARGYLRLRAIASFLGDGIPKSEVTNPITTDISNG